MTVLLTILVAALVASCSSDSSDGGRKDGSRTVRDVYLMLYPQTYDDVTPTVSHRALPTGFVFYDELSPRMSDADTKIHCFMTHGTNVDFQGDFSYKGESSWFSKIPLDDGTYQVFGFMPSAELGKVSIAPQTNYQTGAVITATGLPVLTVTDPCVIVGVKGAGNNVTPIANMNMQLGAFSYNAGDEGDHLYVLLDHLYAALHLRLKIDDDYSQLRTVKLTRLSLTAQQVKSVNVVATLTAGSTAPLSEVVTENTTGLGDEVVLYNGDEQQLYPSTTFDRLVCVAPGVNRLFVMKTTYNVYDRQGNLIRENRTVENTLAIPETTMPLLAGGKKLIFNLTVNPTYIHVLSDPDLDDPKIIIEN